MRLPTHRLQPDVSETRTRRAPGRPAWIGPRPGFVVSLGETTLALDDEIAREIYVRRVEAAPQ